MTNLPEAEEAMRRLVDDGYRVVIAFEQRAEAERAGYVLRRTSGTLVHGGEVEAGPGVSFLPLSLRRHFLIPEIKLALLTDAQVFPRRHKAGPGQASHAGSDALELPRPAQRRLRGPRGPRRGPLRRHLHQDGGGRHPRLPGPGVQRQGHALRAARPDRQGHAVRGGGRSRARAVQTGRQRLGAHQEPGAARRRGRWPANCCISMPFGRRPRASASPRTTSGRCASRRPSPTTRPRTSCGLSTPSRTTWSPITPWTACSAATSATARPRWR